MVSNISIISFFMVTDIFAISVFGQFSYGNLYLDLSFFDQFSYHNS